MTGHEWMEYVRMHLTEPQIGDSPVRFAHISAPSMVWPTANTTEFVMAIVSTKYNRLAVIDIGRGLQKIVMDATRIG